MIKTLASHIKEYKLPSILTPIFMILEVFMETLIPFFMGSIVDQGIKNGDMNHIYLTGILMILVSLFGLFCGFMGGIFAAKASTGFAKNLRKGMFSKIQEYSFANIDKYSTAGLVTRLTTDVTNIQNAYQMLLRISVRAPFSLICAMAMSFFINPKIASVYLIAVLILGTILVIIIINANKYFNNVFKKYDDLNASVLEDVSSIRVVKAYVREDYEKNKFLKAAENVYKLFVKAENVIAFNAPMMQVTVYSCILIISYIGAKMIVASSLTTGELMSLLAYCMNILMSLMMLSMIFVMLSMSVASAKRIAEVLNEEVDLKNPENPITTVKDGSIQFKDVCFKYNKDSENNVLNSINLSINSGETIGIMGGTGSAKTSLVNLISRLYDTTEGSVYVGGEDVKNYDLTVLRNQVSVVLQKNVLFSGTILENLRWGNEFATDEECIEACKLACADDFISKFPDKYNTHIEQGGSNVSGGQKQRLCIARALLKKPKILILDDSTSAVDTATDSKIQEAFAHKIPDVTKLIISQRISSVKNADRIIVMDNGELSDFGTHDELLVRSEIYRDVYEAQTGGSGDFDENGGDN